MTALLCAPVAGWTRRPADVTVRMSWRFSPSGRIAACTVVPRDGAPWLEVRDGSRRLRRDVADLTPSSQLLPLDRGSVLVCRQGHGVHDILRVSPVGSVHALGRSSAQSLSLVPDRDGAVIAVEGFRGADGAWSSRLSTVTVAGLRPLTSLDAEVLGAVRLADQLAVNAGTGEAVRALAVDPSTGRITELLDLSAGSDDRIVDFLPATGQVVVSTDASGAPRLGLGRGRLRFPESLHEPTGVEYLAATADGSRLAVGVEAGVVTRIRLVDTTTFAATALDLPPLVVTGRGSFSGRTLVVPVSTPDRAGTLLRVDTATGRYAFDDPAEPFLAPPRIRSLPGAEGPIESLVFGDPSSAATVVVALPDGPLDAWRVGFDPLLAELDAAGVAVVAPNVRGCTGYGREHRVAVRGAWGGPDLDDVLAVAGHVAGRATTTPVLLGTSYGAYLALLAAATEPHRFAGCVALAPFAGGAQLLSAGGPVAERARRLGGDSAPDVRERLTGPISPVLLLHGGRDGLVPPVQSRLLARALRATGTSVTAYRLPDAGHDLLASSGRAAVVTAITHFLTATGQTRRA